MRTRIYTNREREALTAWLTGKLNRRKSPLLHNLLLRTRRNQTQLTADVTLLALTLRRLNAGLPHHRPDDLDVTIAIPPITLTARDERSYTTNLPRIRHSISTANDQTRPAEERLKAAAEAIQTTLSMINTKIEQ